MRKLFQPFPMLILLCFPLVRPTSLQGQSYGSIEGEVTLAETGDPLHGVAIRLVEADSTAITDREGRYRFARVPPGLYHLLAHLSSALSEETQIVSVQAGGVSRVDFSLHLVSQRFQITVTARGREETAFESFQSVSSMDSFELAESVAPSLGEVFDNQAGSGIAKRSFGPGSSRPVIRGFDGDRVLVMQDGIRTGTLSSQSGDHGELVNTGLLERLEVVKGPSTLLYGSNALGGVVNAISRHHAIHEHPHEGLRGVVSGSGGSANALGGGTAGFEYGTGKWMIWGGGGGQRTGDYDTPEGSVFNSRTRNANGYVGFGWYGDKTFFSLGYSLDDGVYGVPFATAFEAEDEPTAEPAEGEEERIELDAQRQTLGLNWGLPRLGGFIEGFRLQLNLTHWEHDEVEIADQQRQVGTQFDNDQFVYRGVFEQQKRGPLTGRLGFWGLLRDYDVAGEEALSPPVDQDAFAAFTLQELEFEQLKFQFGARLEHTSYQPVGLASRSFTGVSAAAGIHTDLWSNGALVANYAHSYRAAALEELYNNGPHIGTLSFEVGDPQLKAEIGDGVDLSIRHRSTRFESELNLFHYSFDNFVFPFFTGKEQDGLPVLQFTQKDSRYTGAEANLGLQLHPVLWLRLGMDFVDAEETETGTPLPRIPPLRGRIGFDASYKSFTLKPEVILASSQQQIFPTETRTAGYTAVNLKASYTIARQHAIHQFAANFFNIGDRLYRNHSSFIKNLAPEIGRGVRFTYMVRTF